MGPAILAMLYIEVFNALALWSWLGSTHCRINIFLIGLLKTKINPLIKAKKYKILEFSILKKNRKESAQEVTKDIIWHMSKVFLISKLLITELLNNPSKA